MPRSRSDFFLNYIPMDEQCTGVRRRAPHPLDKGQLIFMTYLAPKHGRLAGPLLLKLNDCDFAHVIDRCERLAVDIPDRQRYRILKRALALGCLRIKMAREELSFAAQTRRGKIFAPILERALVDTITRKARRWLGFTLSTIAGIRLHPRVAAPLAQALRDHPDMALQNLNEPRYNQDKRFCLVMIAALGDALTPEQLEAMRPHLTGKLDLSYLCGSSRHQALARHKLTREPGAEAMITWSKARFARFLRDKASP